MAARRRAPQGESRPTTFSETLMRNGGCATHTRPEWARAAKRRAEEAFTKKRQHVVSLASSSHPPLLSPLLTAPLPLLGTFGALRPPARGARGSRDVCWALGRGSRSAQASLCVPRPRCQLRRLNASFLPPPCCVSRRSRPASRPDRPRPARRPSSSAARSRSSRPPAAVSSRAPWPPQLLRPRRARPLSRPSTSPTNFPPTPSSGCEPAKGREERVGARTGYRESRSRSHAGATAYVWPLWADCAPRAACVAFVLAFVLAFVVLLTGASSRSCSFRVCCRFLCHHTHSPPLPSSLCRWFHFAGR